LIAPILISPEHQQEENKEKEYQKLMTVIVEKSGKCKKETMERQKRRITYP
jgi:DNA mismatch repair protein MutH